MQQIAAAISTCFLQFVESTYRDGLTATIVAADVDISVFTPASGSGANKYAIDGHRSSTCSKH